MLRKSEIFIIHNAKDYLLEKLNDVIIGHTNEDKLEIIIVDNASTDNTYEYIKNNIINIKIKYIKINHEVEYSVAREKGIKNATGEIINIYSLNSNSSDKKMNIGFYWNDLSKEIEYVEEVLPVICGLNESKDVNITIYHHNTNIIFLDNINEVILDEMQDIPYECLRNKVDILLFPYSNNSYNTQCLLLSIIKSKIISVCWLIKSKDFFDSTTHYMIRDNDNINLICDNNNQKDLVDHSLLLFRTFVINNVNNNVVYSDLISKWYKTLCLILQARRYPSDYNAVTVDGSSYIATSDDLVVLKGMNYSRKTFSKENIDMFYKLSKKYYGINNTEGLFLDIGANIGTTSIYFKRNLDKDIKIIAFEPCKANYKMLRVNYILNDYESEAKLENFGLGNQQCKMNFHVNKENPGASGVVAKYEKEENYDEVINITTLDDYISDNKINVDNIKYIWIDVEGFEPDVIEGSMNLLSKRAIPIHMEFSPYLWENTGKFDKIIKLLSSVYSKFIYMSEILSDKECLYDIEELKKYRKKNFMFQDDLFLIK